MRLIVELLKPAEGMRICDPTAGSADMLICAAQYLAERGGDPRNLGTLAIGKLNLAATWKLTPAMLWAPARLQS